MRCLALILWLAACFAGRSMAAACETPVKFAQLDWESGQFTTALLRELTERGYGCQTETIPGTTAALEAALVQGDIAVIAEQWDGRSPVMSKAEADGAVEIIGNVMQGGAKQGWYIPSYTAKAHPELKSAGDLAKFKDLFTDPNNPSQPRFLNCPSGWSCEVFNTRLLHNLHLDNAFAKVHPGTGAALDAAIASAYTQQQPLLFYYWQPAGLMAKFDMVPLEFPAYDKTCWDDLLKADGTSACVSGFPVSKLAVAVSAGFAKQQPELIKLFSRVQLPADDLNGAILQMTEGKKPAAEVAKTYLREHPDLVKTWLNDEQAASRFFGAENTAAAGAKTGFFPEWSFAGKMNQAVAGWVKNYGDEFRSVSRGVLNGLLLPIERALLALPPWLVILAASALAWHSMRRLVPVILTAAGIYAIGAFRLWTALMQTVALLTASVAITVIIGVPLGIIMARGRLERFMLPVLDVMQTMPGFVYLIPVLMLFGLGKVPALFATVIYAIAPLIRLTALGIRQVPKPLIEAGTAFGSSRWQMLFWVILPNAMPSIMAGINQAVIMSLSMVVLASMIGAPGLGEPVLQAIQTQNIGQGIEAGAAIVVLAMIIDRITQAYGKRDRA